jgi:hypothetical protein
MGLLQGETLSPLLFSLYISEIEKILRDSGIPGVKIDHTFDLQVLLFADDMVILASTPIYLQKKIDILRQYFLSLGLKVNLAKTKIVIFRKGGRVSDYVFTYGGEKIEIVSEYTYLGVPFSSHCVFSKAATHFKNKGIKAVGAVWNILVRGKANSLEPKLKLFDTIASCVTLYSSHIWGLRYLDIIEQLQLHFLKRLLGVNRAVPSYIIRLETGRPCMKTLVMKQTLLYTTKLLSMPRERYPLKCYLALKQESDLAHTNWYSQLYTWLDTLGFAWLRNVSDPTIIAQNLSPILKSITDMQRQNDIARVNDSTRFSYYSYLIPDCALAAKYLSWTLPVKKLIAQARITCGNFYFNRNNQILSQDEFCKYCNLDEYDTLKHFMSHYLIHEYKRKTLDNYIFAKLWGIWELVLQPRNLQDAEQLYLFIAEALKFRQILDEE